MTPLLWAATGDHPAPPVLSNEPLTADALPARRQEADDTAAEKGQKAARTSEIDVSPAVVAHGIRNTEDGMALAKKLIVHAKKSCTSAMQSFLLQNSARLSGIIDDI